MRFESESESESKSNDDNKTRQIWVNDDDFSVCLILKSETTRHSTRLIFIEDDDFSARVILIELRQQ
jgi:hypothetical protein